MKVSRITTDARDVNVDIALAGQVSVLCGPNGAGKTTALTALLVAVSGCAFDRRRQVRRPGDLLDLLDVNAKSVSSKVWFDGEDGAIIRVLRRTSTGATTTLASPWTEPGAAQRDVASAIHARIGDPSVFDVNDFLRLAPGKRRERLMALCSSSVKPWTPEELGAAIREASLADDVADVEAFDQSAFDADGVVVIQDGPLMTALTAKVESAGDAAKKNAKQLSQTVEALRAQATMTPAAENGHSSTASADVTDLDMEIETLAQQIGTAQSTNTARKRLQAERAQLDQGDAPPETDEVAAQDAQLSKLRVRLENLESEPVTDPELIALRAALHQAHAHARDRSTQDAFDMAWPRISAVCEPKALGFAAFKAGITAAAEIGSSSPEVSALMVDIEEIVDEDRQRVLDIQRTRVEIRGLEAGLAPLKAVAARAAQDQARIAEIDHQLADLPFFDPESLQVQLDGARSRREAAKAQLASLRESEALQTNRRRLQVEKADLEAAQVVLDQAVAVWTAVRARYITRAVSAFIDVCDPMLPDGWSISFDADSDFSITRPNRSGEVSSLLRQLSDGELGLCVGAFSAALASVSGAPWRVVLADNAGQMSADPDDVSPDGRFVRFVEGLAHAVNAGELDQAIVATCRLEPSEVKALEAMDVEIVRLGDRIARGDSEKYSHVKREAIKEAVASLDAGGVRAFYQDVLGMPCGSIPMARGRALQNVITKNFTSIYIETCCKQINARRAR